MKKKPVRGLYMVLLVVKSSALLVFFYILLKVLPFEKFKALYARFTSGNGGSTVRLDDLVYSVSLPGRYLKSTCLPQALTLKYYLKNDPAARLVIGINNNIAERFSAHAWIEKDGRVILGGSSNAVYTPIWTWE